LGASRLYKLNFELSGGEWAAMQPQGVRMRGAFGWDVLRSLAPKAAAGERQVHPGTYADFPWARGQLVENGQTYKDVGVRYRGSATASRMGRASPPHPSFI